MQVQRGRNTFPHHIKYLDEPIYNIIGYSPQIRDVSSSVSRSLVDSQSGSVTRNVSGDYHNELVFDYVGLIEISGYLAGTPSGDIQGTISGDVSGTLNVEVNGQIFGIISGEISGKMSESVNGIIYGTTTTPQQISGILTTPPTEITLSGTASGYIYGNVSTTVNGTGFGTTTDASGNLIEISGDISKTYIDYVSTYVTIPVSKQVTTTASGLFIETISAGIVISGNIPT